MDLQLQDKVALVTGGSKGIGEAVVRTFLAEGGQVANINRSTAEGEALALVLPRTRQPRTRPPPTSAPPPERPKQKPRGKPRRPRRSRR